MARCFVQSARYATEFFSVEQVAAACVMAVRVDGTVYREGEDGVTRRYAGRYWEAALRMKAEGKL